MRRPPARWLRPRDILSESVFDRALGAHGGLIERIVATHEKSTAAREDVMQEVALALWRAAPGWRGDCSLRTFVARVTHNVCIDHVRRMTREPRREELTVDIRSNAEAPDEAAVRFDMERRLITEVAGLPAALRDVAVLTLEGFSPQEIADTLGLSEGTVATRATRARAALRERLKDQL